MNIRLAQRGDRDAFLTLWTEMLSELAEHGGDALPTEKTVAFYGAVFDHYAGGLVPGHVLLAEDGEALAGGLVAGEPLGPNPQDLRFGRIALGFGTYVRPAYRARGVSKALYEVSLPRLRSLGIETFLGGYHKGNESAARLLYRFGAQDYHTSVAIRLGEER